MHGDTQGWGDSLLTQSCRLRWSILTCCRSALVHACNPENLHDLSCHTTPVDTCDTYSSPVREKLVSPLFLFLEKLNPPLPATIIELSLTIIKRDVCVLALISKIFFCCIFWLACSIHQHTTTDPQHTCHLHITSIVQCVR